MRKYAVLLSSLAAMVVAGVPGTASAATTCDVLTYGGPCGSGNNVAVGDILSSHLPSGASAVVSTGFVSVSCSKAALGGTVAKNSSVTAAVSGASLKFSGCTSNLGTVSASSGSSGSISFSTSNVVTLAGEQFSFAVFGTTCEYETSNTTLDTGSASNSTQVISFNAIPVVEVASGSGGACSSTGTLTFSANLTDSTHGGAPVYYND